MINSYKTHPDKFPSVFEWEKEQDYLRQQHKNGWKFVRVSFIGVYHFERCRPEDTVYQLDYNKSFFYLLPAQTESARPFPSLTSSRTLCPGLSWLLPVSIILLSGQYYNHAILPSNTAIYKILFPPLEHILSKCCNQWKHLIYLVRYIALRYINHSIAPGNRICQQN